MMVQARMELEFVQVTQYGCQLLFEMLGCTAEMACQQGDRPSTCANKICKKVAVKKETKAEVSERVSSVKSLIEIDAFQLRIRCSEGRSLEDHPGAAPQKERIARIWWEDEGVRLGQVGGWVQEGAISMIASRDTDAV